MQKPGSMVAFSARSWNAKLSPDVSAETHLSRRLPSGGDGARLAPKAMLGLSFRRWFSLETKNHPSHFKDGPCKHDSCCPLIRDQPMCLPISRRRHKRIQVESDCRRRAKACGVLDLGRAHPGVMMYFGPACLRAVVHSRRISATVSEL